ncbi:MAG TPA: STAS domain-containing protein [Firmicutes bacterium]|jgi:anti-sigma B factor antagonist|nr:STAS domain-containing protein [Bacillota bacterium]
MLVEKHSKFGIVIAPEKIDLTNAREFKEAFQSLFESDYKLIRVDCRELAMIDSAGLGSLVMFQKRLKERDGELELVNVNHKYIKHLFDMLELGRVIKIGNT